MSPVKKRVELDGSIAIGEALAIAKIQPGDWNKRTKHKGTVKAAAGILRNCNDLAEKMSQIREDEDDRPGTNIQ